MAQSEAPSGTASEFATSEMPFSVMGEATPARGGTSYPPYPPYSSTPAPPSVADTIIAGRDMRLQHKSLPRQAVHPPPKPARPKGPKATDVKLNRRSTRAHARCLKRHGAVLSDRLERMAKPPRRNIICLWREHAGTLPPETIARLRSMLDADEPFKPDQAYEYFINLRKNKKKTTTTAKVNEIKKDVLAMCADKRFVWARNATVAFARGIQQRLACPGRYVLADRMLRLSNICLERVCCYMRMRTPSRRSTNPKAKFVIEMADKIAVWMDEIIAEADDRMLMMDYDEDEEVIGADEAGDAGFADSFLDMMGGGGLLTGPQPAYLKFTGPMLEAFLILTDSMTNKGDEQLLTRGKFSQTYKEAADALKQTPDFHATEFDTALSNRLHKILAETAKPNTPGHLAACMREIVDISSNYLAQNAEFNKDKGPAFKLLVKTMNMKPNEQLYQKGKAARTYGKAAKELEQAHGLDSDHDDPNLSQQIHSSLSKSVDSVTPADLKTDMKETLDMCSKYLSQRAIDEIERGPAFDLLIKELQRHGNAEFTPQFPSLDIKFAAAYVLKSAPGLTSSTPDPATVPIFNAALHKAVDAATPRNLKNDMNEVIERCSNYLSSFIRDRGRAMEMLLKKMKANGKKELVRRNDYVMDYETGAHDTETAPLIVPFLPVKDIADEVKGKLTQDMESSTPPDLKTAMKSLVQDVSSHLSQAVAMRSGVAGERYPLNFLASVKHSLGTRPLYKYKSLGQTYKDASEELRYAGPLQYDPNCEDLQHQISSEMHRGVPTKLAPSIAEGLRPTMHDASKHLAKVGTEKGEALDYVVTLMKKEGDTPLGQLQGYTQSYNDGARRIENAPSLANDKVDKGAYESVRGKLTNLTDKTPAPEHAKHLPGILDDSSKFLASPFPETELEKRRVLADLMARKADNIVGKEGLYKLTYKEGGEEIMEAPVGVTTSHDEGKKNEMLGTINTVMPDKKMAEVLKDPAREGAAHLTDVIKGRGEAMQVIHDNLQKEKSKEFLNVGKFKTNHQEAAQMLEKADHFGGQNPSPVLMDKVTDQLNALPLDKTKPHMKDTTAITAAYIAGKATKESGLGAKDLAGLDGQGQAGKAGSPSSPGTHVGGADAEARRRAEEEERKRREEEERRRREAEERRRREEEEAERKRRAAEMRAKGGIDVGDPDRAAAMGILHTQLKAKGGETFYKQPHTELSHAEASQWLSNPPEKIDKTVKESADTARLQKKFERKLSSLVNKNTPPKMVDTMQDVVIESSRMLSEKFVSSNYKALARDALISEMQKRGNEKLVEVDGEAETYFFAAQRLKKAKSLEVKEPCADVAYHLTKKLDDMIRSRSMARKLTTTMKDHTKVAGDYLSEQVTKPDEQIEAYVALLGEMEAAGDALLIEGDIPKSYKDAAAYLRQLTSATDQINRPNSSLQSQAESKLKGIMANVTPAGYTPAVMAGVITDSTKLLVSYIMLQGEKTEALKILIEQMDQAGDKVLLRHGTISKSFTDGANILRGKNTDQLRVSNVDPVVTRKIQIKLHNLMNGVTPDKYKGLMDDVIEDATMYLAVHFLSPQMIQVCKCMKNVFVQCELWCDEILRRVARPCCTCSRHVSAQALQDLAPAQRLQIIPGSSKAFAPGIEISLSTCPSKLNKSTCPGRKPTPGCQNIATTSYLLHSTVYNRQSGDETSPRYPPETESLCVENPTSPTSEEYSPMHSMFFEPYPTDLPSYSRFNERDQQPEHEEEASEGSPDVYYTPTSNTHSPSRGSSSPFWQSPTTMFAKIHTQERMSRQKQTPTDTSRIKRSKTGFSSRTPIVSTDQMADWHAMMVSLMWNVQAWRDWIQEYINRALNYKYEPSASPSEAEEKWTTLQRRIATEALQWRQYNNFSRQLTLRLALRYRDKNIVSPTRATVKTEMYMDCQKEMLDIIDMFHRWTHWLSAVVKETDSLQQVPGSDVPLHELRWNHFKKKIEEYSEDWIKYNVHLKICWEHKYKSLISEWLPSWEQKGPVWVVSACGAVPSGAVAAGVYDGEVTWVARTTHKSNVLPAALHPSKHCCLVYADGAVHHYTKYQVMCNAEVKWVAWRAGEVGARAIKVAAGVYVGRVHYRGSHLLGAVHAPSYRCHVVIFGRPFAFNCYELLVLAGEDR
ncbi:hypothetical protein ABMA27_006959 [Loxostege sticticalis]|uniref:Uncharacterized protein n=1 Tax=Loxostege sticticalis TaxID=481309 RepID=A0ABR3IL23_LOXSC